MRKIRTVLFCLITALLLIACQDNTNKAGASKSTNTSEMENIPTPAVTPAAEEAPVLEETDAQEEAEAPAVQEETEEPVEPSEVWKERLDLPTAEEVAACNRTSTQRSPYITGWLNTGDTVRFSQYAADFKADYLPASTYCSLANFNMDYPSLKSQYAKIYSEGDISVYAGFQRRDPGQTNVGILAFWDIYCEDENGNVTKITPERVYPESDEDTNFGGEGEGVHTLADYDWKQGKWYRMLIQCGTSDTTGNTTVEQWVQDLESGEWSYLSKYDLGVKDAAFTGNVAVFLENFNPESAGEIRSMELRNARICPEGSDKWISLREGYFLDNYDYPGSYNYGTDQDIFWMITTGVSGRAGAASEPKTLTVTGGEDSAPLD